MRKKVLSITKKDLRIDTFRAGGKGGQNQNARDSGVRITHPPSGATGEGRDSRKQKQNKRAAFKRMVADPRLMRWIKLQVGEESKPETPTRRYTYKGEASIEKRKMDRE